MSVEQLREGLNKILSIVDKRSTRPILSYSQIKAENNILELTATDLEVSAKICLEANVETSGTFCVNAKNIFDILRELPNSKISLEVDEENNTLQINCGDIHYSLLIYKNDEFPHMVFSNQQNEFILNAKQLLDIMQKTSHAISTDETRLNLNGIFIQEVNNKLRAVATDGHRLSLIETDVTENNNDTLINGIIIPRKGVQELKKIAESFSNSELKISVDDSFIYINADDKYFLSVRLIAREYPKYQAVIPNKTVFKLTTDKTTLHDAIKRIKIMSNEKSNGVKAKLTDNEMTLIANHPSLGHAMEKIPVSYNGKEMEIGFNAKYLIDTLTTFDEGDVTLELNNELSPVIIKSVKEPNYFGLIMPLKL
jgi:DNA polymerase-3 subunit beta